MTVPYYAADGVTLHLGDSLDVLPMLADASVDAIVCDPPYALTEFPTSIITDALTAWLTDDRAHIPATGTGFMGRDWDRFVPPPAIWDKCLRVLKPGGHLVAFAGARTADLMGLSIRLAGFEIRDSLHWIYGSGFPKSMDVSKAIDKAAGAERDVVGYTKAGASSLERVRRVEMGYRENLTNVDTTAIPVTVAATEDAKHWQGWGTALKPAHEPIILARKPFAGTVAGTVLEYGTGALNIDGCRVEHGADVDLTAVQRQQHRHDGNRNWRLKPGHEQSMYAPGGRWPTNIILTHPPLLDEDGQPVGDACAEGCVDGCPITEMDAQSGVRTSGKMHAGTERSNRGGWAGPMPATTGGETYGDSGGASRFFPIFRYQAKAPAKERPRLADGTAWPTVKPLALMRWLVRLVTPPGGTVLDWCAGTGTTLEAARLEGFPVIGVERDRDAADLCRIRLAEPYSVALFGDIA